MAYIQLICTDQLYSLSVLRVWEAPTVVLHISRGKSDSVDSCRLRIHLTKSPSDNQTRFYRRCACPMLTFNHVSFLARVKQKVDEWLIYASVLVASCDLGEKVQELFVQAQRGQARLFYVGD